MGKRLLEELELVLGLDRMCRFFLIGVELGWYGDFLFSFSVVRMEGCMDGAGGVEEWGFFF